jgi:endonuclease III
MLSSADHDTVRRLLRDYGQTFAEELDIKLQPSSPSGLFRLLCAALLFSARISGALAVRAAQGLTNAGWTTPRKMAEATWEQRAKVLNRSGYARYDEKTSTMLEDTSRQLLQKYDGDLRDLRSAAGSDPQRERELLKEFKGIGDVGVDIFFREAQTVWPELYPFVDKRAGRAAQKLGLPSEAETLAQLVLRQQFAKFIAALVRVDLAKAYADMKGTARAERNPNQKENMRSVRGQ